MPSANLKIMEGEAIEVSLDDVRSRLQDLVDQVGRDRSRVVIARQGEPTVVLLSLDELEGLEETLEILQDTDELRATLQGLREAQAGETVPLEDAFPRDKHLPR